MLSVTQVKRSFPVASFSIPYFLNRRKIPLWVNFSPMKSIVGSSLSLSWVLVGLIWTRIAWLLLEAAVT